MHVADINILIHRLTYFLVHYLKHTFMKTNSGYWIHKFSLLIIKDKSFALSDILVLLVVNFQDAFGPHKAESSHASSPKRDFSCSNKAFPRKTATVGKKRAPQNVLVMDTGSDGGGRLAALVDPSPSGAAAKAGRMYLVRGNLGRRARRARSTGSCQRTILPSTRPTGTSGSDTRRNSGSARSISERPLSWPDTCITVMAP